MRWPWEKKQDMAKTDNKAVTAPARDEIQKSHERMVRVNRILLEARDAEALVIKARR